MPNQRFVGLDVHKRHVVAAAVDAQQGIVMKPRKVMVDQFVAWARANLQATDEVAFETTSNAWAFHDVLAPLVN
jgi:hypothetical protein